jgi:hypothetical protein
MEVHRAGTYGVALSIPKRPEDAEDAVYEAAINSFGPDRRATHPGKAVKFSRHSGLNRDFVE